MKFKYQLPDHLIEYGVELNVGSVNVAPEYQRDLDLARCKRYAADFIPGAVGTIVVSQREDGSLWACDGQHRLEVLKLKGIEKVSAEVHHGLNLAQESVLFLIKNDETVSVRPVAMYKAGVTGGIPKYLMADKVLKMRHLEVSKSPSANKIGAVNAVVGIVEMWGTWNLFRSLAVAEQAWGRTSESWDGALLGGLARFIAKHGNSVTDAALAKKLARKGTAYQWKGLVFRQAEGKHSGSGGRPIQAYEAIKDCWNSGRREENRIP